MAAGRPEDDYDLVVKAKLFRDVYDTKVGWAIKDTYKEAVISAANVHTVYVAPVGHFNAGKTFVTNKLSGKNFPCGDRKHTEGLSIAVTRSNPSDTTEPSASSPVHQIAWMDTAGMNSPVVECEGAMQEGADKVEMAPANLVESDPAAAAEHGRKSMEALYTQLREVKRLEDFHRHAAFEFADVFLFVINQISHNDQLEILLLLQRIHRAGVNKSVFVVHNLRGWTVEQLNEKKDDGYTYITRIQTLFFMKDTKVNVSAYIDAEKNLVLGGEAKAGQQAVAREVIKLYGTFQHPAGSRVEMQHVFLVDDKKDAIHNACVLAHLRNEVTITIAKPGSVKARLERVVTKLQPQFAQTNLQNPPPLQVVKGEDGKWRMVAVPKEGEVIQAQTRALQLPSYLTLGSDDLQYNVLKLKGSTATTSAAAASATAAVNPGATEKIMYAVQFVIPGLTPLEVAQIKEDMKWNSGALRLEQTPEGRKALVIDFATTEHVAQGQLLAKLQASLNPEAVAFTENSLTLVEDGTRPYFDRSSNTRPVTVQIRTGLEKLSTMTRPLVAYNDGILSIVVTSSEKPPKPTAAPAAAAAAA